jgi:hypothetical protein
MDTSQLFTETYVLTPAAPGEAQRLSVTEPTLALARSVGQVKAVEQAGWLAYVYGTCTIRRTSDGKTTLITCKEVEP